jgi:hypothetical protein
MIERVEAFAFQVAAIEQVCDEEPGHAGQEMESVLRVDAGDGVVRRDAGRILAGIACPEQ